MPVFVVPLSEIDQGMTNQVGSKAVALGSLLAAGFPVPPGLCLTTAAWRAALEPYRPAIRAYLDACHWPDPDAITAVYHKIRHELASLTIPPDVIAQLQAAWPTIATADTPLAVRSSATAEDRADASFAGQYETILGVHGQTAVDAAILTCWRSFFTPHALFSRWQHQALGGNEGMALLIQPLIEPDCAGVCLTHDPIQAQEDVMVINAAWGLGQGVVDGTVGSDTVWINRHDLTIEKQHIVEKKEQVTRSAAGQPQPTAVPPTQQRAACLPPAWARQIAQFGLTLERFFGRPQDIEWAIAQNRLWLLQSRPLTALPPDLAAAPPFPVAWADEADAQHLWRLALYSQGETPPLPLEHDYMAVRESIREETCLALGVDRNETVQIWNGRAYVRPIPLPLTPADKRIRHQAHEDLKARLQAQGKTSWDHWGPEIIQAGERLQAFDTTQADGPALAEHLENALAVLRHHSSLHPRLWFKPHPAFFAAFTAVSGLTGAAAETAAYRLLDGEETHLTRLIDAVYELACLARSESAVAALVAQPPPDVLNQLARLPAAAAFQAQFTHILAVYGDRTGEGYGSEMTMRTPTWREDPTRLLQLAATYLDPAIPPPAAARAQARQAYAAQVDALCHACEDQTAVDTFRRQLAYARQSMAVLEEHNHYIEQVTDGQLRQAIMAAAQWLVTAEAFTTTEEIFWLYFAEIVTALRQQPPPSLAATITARRAQQALWATLTPPPILGMPPADLPARPPFTDDVQADHSPTLTGIGASAGTSSGPARVVAKGASLSHLAPGDIVVAENAGPLWTPFFPLLGGLVLEKGSLGQHAAAAAREYGVPTIINVLHATRAIPDGVQIYIDGTTGTITLNKEVL